MVTLLGSNHPCAHDRHAGTRPHTPPGRGVPSSTASLRIRLLISSVIPEASPSGPASPLQTADRICRKLRVAPYKDRGKGDSRDRPVPPSFSFSAFKMISFLGLAFSLRVLTTAHPVPPACRDDGARPLTCATTGTGSTQPLGQVRTLGGACVEDSGREPGLCGSSHCVPHVQGHPRGR